MLSEPGATIARGLLLAASLAAVIWSIGVAAERGWPGAGTAAPVARPPKTRGVMAELVFGNPGRGSAPVAWPQVMRPQLAAGGMIARPEPAPQAALWQLPPLSSGWTRP